MALLTTEAIVLHSFDYMESSRIVRLVTRDAGLRSALARGARKAARNFGGGLNLFSEGTAHLHTKPGRELDMLAAFDATRIPSGLGEDLGRFLGASALAELTLRFTREGSADTALYESVRDSLQLIESATADQVAAATVAAGWRLVQEFGYAPALDGCVDCDRRIEADERALFILSAGGVVCAACSGPRTGRFLPGSARSAIEQWLRGEPAVGATASELRAHERLFYEFVSEHLLDGRPTPALAQWYCGLGGES
jgi:DNA repair protein RecO (recombination protein O)